MTAPYGSDERVAAPTAPADRAVAEAPLLVPPLVRLTARMNRGAAKTLWTGYQRAFGARILRWATTGRLHLRGLEHAHAVSPERPLLLVANHRTFLDLYMVSSILLLQVPGRWRLFFPVRGRYCYQSAKGAVLNAAAAGWAMYPPFFREPGTRALDRLMLERLVELLREGPGNVVGFHPEGTRNQDADPWSLLAPHPGVGELVLAARPQILPVFTAGLTNDVRAFLTSERRVGAPVRVHFGPPVPPGAYDAAPRRARGYVEVARDLMGRIGALAEADRREFGAPAR